MSRINCFKIYWAALISLLFSGIQPASATSKEFYSYGDTLVSPIEQKDTVPTQVEIEDHKLIPTPAVVVDSVSPTQQVETKQWIPDPQKATWLALIIPGGGQIYNKKYWKLPIFYGGFAGCAYAISWNNKTYKDYAQAYRDIMDDNPNTNSFLDLLPPNSNWNESQLKTLLKNRKDRFRRYRDLSVFALIGVYVLSVVDAYVDAELSNFDITPDLSMRIEPTIFKDNGTKFTNQSVGIQCSLRF